PITIGEFRFQIEQLLHNKAIVASPFRMQALVPPKRESDSVFQPIDFEPLQYGLLHQPALHEGFDGNDVMRLLQPLDLSRILECIAQSSALPDPRDKFLGQLGRPVGLLEEYPEGSGLLDSS